MRLIDADEMIKRLQEWNTKDDMDTALFNFALHRILEQPTAYDVDEVVKQLNEKKENLGFIKAITDTSAYIKGINDAIKIWRSKQCRCLSGTKSFWIVQNVRDVSHKTV
jgi:hypothetical protein